MALDEAVLLMSAPKALTLRVYSWRGEACTFGFSQKYADAKAACGPGIEPVRRATGGGIVHHDGDTTFSLVFPWDRSCAPEAIYKNIHRGVHQALKAAGIAAAMATERRPGLAASCFARPECADLVDREGRKILGGALRNRGAKGLYQGSLRLTVGPEVLVDAVRREFGEPSLELDPAWLNEGVLIREKYLSADWNARR